MQWERFADVELALQSLNYRNFFLLHFLIFMITLVYLSYLEQTFGKVLLLFLFYCKGVPSEPI